MERSVPSVALIAGSSAVHILHMNLDRRIVHEDWQAKGLIRLHCDRLSSECRLLLPPHIDRLRLREFGFDSQEEGKYRH